MSDNSGIAACSGSEKCSRAGNDDQIRQIFACLACFQLEISEYMEVNNSTLLLMYQNKSSISVLDSINMRKFNVHFY